MRQAFVEILRASGYTVFEAPTSADAVKIVEQCGKRLDILLTNILMHGLRGPELAHLVSQCHPEVRVVYMSGYAEDLPEIQATSNSPFLQKPFRFATLLEQLKLVQRKSLTLCETSFEWKSLPLWRLFAESASFVFLHLRFH